ncbi:MAG: helix-turn-helix domain-containing protein [Bacilli bacterium]
MKFGDNLKKIRKLKKFSQEELAEKVGVSRQSVSKWETGDAYPEMNNILELCKIFHCKINDLVNDSIIDIDSLDDETKTKVISLKKEEQKKMKCLSKIIYIIARIGKIIVTITIPILILCMICLPYLINKTEVVNNEIKFNDSSNKITIIEKNISNSSSIKIKYNDVVVADATDENITIIKNIFKNNSKVMIITCIETSFLILIICVILMRSMLKHLENLFININSGDTPFTLENINHLKQIAYLMIGTIILPNIFGIIFEFLMKTDLGIGFELFDIIEILFLFSLSYIFEYGRLLGVEIKGQIYDDNNE